MHGTHHITGGREKDREKEREISACWLAYANVNNTYASIKHNQVCVMYGHHENIHKVKHYKNECMQFAMYCVLK